VLAVNVCGSAGWSESFVGRLTNVRLRCFLGTRERLGLAARDARSGDEQASRVRSPSLLQLAQSDSELTIGEDAPSSS
jgi:hypothetical protein